MAGTQGGCNPISPSGWRQAGTLLLELISVESRKAAIISTLRELVFLFPTGSLYPLVTLRPPFHFQRLSLHYKVLPLFFTHMSKPLWFLVILGLSCIV